MRVRALPALQALLALASCAGRESSSWFWDTASRVEGGDADDWQTPRVHIDASLLPWSEESDTEQCNFWNGTYQWSLGLCSHFAISRIGNRIDAQAVERALHCAARHSTDCVLAPEVGVGLPALFIYDAERGMRLLLAPRMLELESAASPSATVNVRVHDPSGETASRMMSMGDEVRVEFLTTASKALQVETLKGADAFCVQLMRNAISQACWDALD